MSARLAAAATGDWLGLGQRWTIGTVLFVQIGTALPIGGSGSLLIAFLLWSSVVLSINNCLSEMVTWIPISSPFARFADRFVDEVLGVCSGVNFFLSLGLSVPFEITAFNLMLNFWTDKMPAVAVSIGMILCYAGLNIFAVRYYGESEFWLALGKVVLIIGLLIFTFVVMVGGNPDHDVFGFRNWDGQEHRVLNIYNGSLGRFLGFLSCLIQAAFTVAGPEFVSMTAGEASHPRQTLPRCFSTVGVRLLVSFILGALSVGILVPHTDPNLLASTTTRRGAGTSPYVIAMEHLHIKGLAHVVNALVMLSIFSAGNSYVFSSSRALCNNQGVLVYCVSVTMLFSLLAFLQVSHNSAVVLQWITRFITVASMANYSMIAFTYLRFHAALNAQGISKASLPHRSAWQPFCAYYAFIASFTMIFFSGYTVFLPGHWNTTTFVFTYALVGVLPVIFLGWKTCRHTEFRKPGDIDLFTEERVEVDDNECSIEGEQSTKSQVKKAFAFF
ncbi:amino acid permease/ SLC12A domain-containing protein [Mycena sp. CBHHK59/15]|nr:amino acid permease/ SLC12A domain-containing protein [Mycena sp. CBHHK59/15]